MATTPRAAEEFKKELKFRAARLREIADVLPDGEPVVATVKVDGELIVWSADVPAGVVTFFNRNENERFLEEIASDIVGALSNVGITTARGAGELYAVTDKGRPQSFEKSIGLIKRTAVNREKAAASWSEQVPLRLAIFDVFEVDGHALWGTTSYADRMTWIFSVFPRDGGSAVPVIGQVIKGEADPVKKMWKKHVLEGGYEGIVIRANGSIKIKPIITVDVAVIGFTRGQGKAKIGIGALALAFRGWDGHYEPAGKVGGGFTDAERKWWLAHLRPAKTSWKERWTTGVTPCYPDFVVEVAAERFTRRHDTSWTFEGGIYKAVGGFTARIVNKPRFVRRRPDKTQSPYDLRLSQIPGENEMGARVVPERGDDAAFKYLLEISRDDLLRISQRKKLVALEDFDDIYNDTVVKALEMWRRLNASPDVVPTGAPRPGKRMLPWLTQIMKNRAIDVHRKTKRQREKLEQIELHDPERARRARPRKNPKRKRRIRT